MASANTWTLEAHPFETLLSLKQRITLHHDGARTWAPTYQFLATRKADGWAPVEYVWPFGDVADPLDPAVRGKPDARLMEGDVRKPIFPTILSGITLEQLGSPEEIHVWPLAALVEGLTITDAIFGGYLQLYFPALKTPAEVDAVLDAAGLTMEEKETLTIMKTYREVQDARIEVLNTKIAALPKDVGAALRELRRVRFLLPTHALPEGLEILFYAMQASADTPVLRYFPAQQRTPPLLKLATGPTGIPVITNAGVLRALLAEQPATDAGAVLLVRALVHHPRAPEGTAWSLRIYEDGSAELVLAAPRRDKPLPASAVAAALAQLPAFLAATPWTNTTLADTTLVELSALYEYTVQQEVRKPTKVELQKRATPFQAFFVKEDAYTRSDTTPILKGDGSAVALRWKAVSNFREESDPVMNFLTTLFLKTGADAADTLSMQTYVGALAREFGMGPAEAGESVRTWLRRQAEFVVTDADAPEKAVAAHAYGASVSVYNAHPKYLFQILKAESAIDVQRILTLLEVWVSFTSEELTPASETKQRAAAAATAAETAAAAAEEAAAAVEEAPVDPDQEAAWDQLMNFSDMGFTAVEENVIEEVQATQPTPTEAAVAEADATAPTNIRYPARIAEDENPLPAVKDEFYLEQLRQRNTELFSYSHTGDPRVKLYSRSCQNNANKQPNILSPEAYQRVRTLYGDSVHWLEAPLSTRDALATRLAYRSKGERPKEARRLGISAADLVILEKRALALGFPLKGGESTMKTPDPEMQSLLTFQASKPLWVVIRAGTQADKPNYYICAEYWCVRDDLPITESDFVGTTYKNGGTKAANTCPFCGGGVIQVRGAPKWGETVIKRGPSAKGGTKTARFAGFLSDLYHPDRFALPCCFVDPDNLIPPEGAQAPPRAVVPLPDAQQEAAPAAQAAQEVLEAAVPEAAAAAAAAVAQPKNLMDVFEDTRYKYDYSEPTFRFLTADKKATAEGKYKILEKDGKIEIKAKRILRTYILEADRFPLEFGKVGLLPAAVDAFLGQDRKRYLGSASHGQIYTHPDVNGQAFFRLGLGVTARDAGRMLLQLFVYVRSAVGQLVPPHTTELQTPEDILTDVFETREVLAFHAFQQANYGTLLHEFADPQRAVQEGEFQNWCGRMGIPLPDQRAYALTAYKAWLNFQAYTRDETEAKDLRLWEHLFAAPGLFSATGVLIARIRQEADGAVVLHCPSLGVSVRSQIQQPPLLLLYEDRITRLCEPLVLFQGPDILMGVFEPGLDMFGHLTPALRTPLAAFYTEFLSPKQGCGRPAPPSHPWMAERPQTGIPRLGSLLDRLEEHGLIAHSLLRDRTARLVGVRVSTDGEGPNKPLFFLPVVDDGTIDIRLGSVMDVEHLPTPPLVALLNVLVGSGSAATQKKSLSADFQGLTPYQLRSARAEGGGTMFVGVETLGGAFLPIEHLSDKATVDHVAFTRLLERGVVAIDQMPWEEDLFLLGSAPLTEGDRKAQQVLQQNPEEALLEAYQHVRLSLSEWMDRTAEGQMVKKQIQLLRKARGRLPLFELRKRGDLLLFPYIKQWIHVAEDARGASTSLLRRDCLQVTKKEACQGACSWSEGRCKIHAVGTPRFVDPVYVITARLVDELLRTYGEANQVLEHRVSRLKTPTGVVTTAEGVVAKAEGRGDDALFAALGLTGRLPSRYGHGLLIPEELGQEDVGYEPTAAGIPLTWVGIQHPVWHAEISRDPAAQRQAFWVAFLGKSWSALESLFVPAPQWSAVAKQKGVHILLTRMGPQGYTLSEWVGASTSSSSSTSSKTKNITQPPQRRFLLLDPEGMPLQTVKGEYAIPESDLPTPIRQWLDAAKMTQE